jgi:hypothetical protein
VLAGVLLGACGGSAAGPDAPPAPPDAASFDAGPDAAWGACGPVQVPGGSDNPGFGLPTDGSGACQTLAAWLDEETPTTLDLSCLGTPSDDEPTGVAVSLQVSVVDFQNDDALGAATVAGFVGADPSDAFDSAIANGSGQAQLMAPSGLGRHGYRIAAADYLETYELNRLLGPAQAAQSIEVNAVSFGSAAALAALVGVSRTPQTGATLVTLRDCSGHPISGAIATVSTTSGAVSHAAGGQTFYIAASSGLPVRNSTLATTSARGQASVIELAPNATAYVQLWGIPPVAEVADRELVLIAEQRVPVGEDTFALAGLGPRRD